MSARVTECVQEGARWICTEIPPEVLITDTGDVALVILLVVAACTLITGSGAALAGLRRGFKASR